EYDQRYPAHQGNGPGYASTYAIVGESIRELQNRAKRNGKNIVDFNTYACSMAFPARAIFEERLRELAARYEENLDPNRQDQSRHHDFLNTYPHVDPTLASIDFSLLPPHI